MVARHVQGFSSAADRRTLEFRIVRPDGSVRWLLDRGQAMPVGRPARSGWRVIGTALDITERKQAEERQRLLMAELDHRVKNTLSNVSAVAHLSSHRAATVGSFVQALDGRIQAMSQAHALLARGAWAGTDLRELVTEVLTPFLTRAKDNIRIDGEAAWVLPELTQSLALTLHELATNALKHGALSTPAGHVLISWTIRRCRAAPASAAGLARRGRSHRHTTDDARLWPHRSQGGGLRRRRAGRVSVRTNGLRIRPQGALRDAAQCPAHSAAPNARRRCRPTKPGRAGAHLPFAHPCHRG